MTLIRIVAGRHTGPDKDGNERTVIANAKDGGDIIDTNQDLLALNGPQEMSPKFVLVQQDNRPLPTDRNERIDKQLALLGTAQTPAPPPALDKMSVKELRELAEDQEIEVGGEQDKAKLIAIIRKVTN